MGVALGFGGAGGQYVTFMGVVIALTAPTKALRERGISTGIVL